MKVIGIGGQLGSGKDSLADYLAKRLNERVTFDYSVRHWRRIGFANAVKKVFMDSFDVSWDFIEKWKRIPEPSPGFDRNVRQSLQFIGDGFRQIRSNIWIETAFREDVPKIISDVRYLNEAGAIKDHDGFTCLVWRAGHENNDPNPSEAQIKPTVDWFVKSGLEGYVRDKDLPGRTILYPEMPRVARGGETLPEGVPGRPDNLAWEGDALPSGVMHPALFDFFIRNEGTLDQLYEKVDDLIVPVIEDKYGYKPNSR